MKNIKNVKLVVGATGYYIKWASMFCEYAHNLFGTEDENNIYKYNIVIITDMSHSLYNKTKEELVRILDDKNTCCIEDIKLVNCPDFPWPVITLYKPFLCAKYIEDTDDIVWCGNINIKMQENDRSWYDDTKVNISWHHKHPGPDFNSKPYYVQGGFVCGAREIMRGFCTEWQAMINGFINRDRIVPEWHDETVLNLLFNENRNQFNPNFILMTDEQDREAMPGQFALLNMTGKIDNVFKENWKS